MTPLVTLISVEYNALLMSLFILNVFFFGLYVCNLTGWHFPKVGLFEGSLNVEVGKWLLNRNEINLTT